jgi:hypothetical protein
MTRSEFLRTVFTQGVALTLLSTASPAAGKWEYLGESNVDGAIDHDTIRIGSSQGYFRRIQIFAQNGAIHFDRVVVHFGNGEALPVQIASRITPGGHTREIDLSGGNKRLLQSVEFWYQKGGWGNGQKPKVRLMGIRW